MTSEAVFVAPDVRNFYMHIMYITCTCYMYMYMYMSVACLSCGGRVKS